MAHVVLLGDSIFDNGAYVRPGEPDVITQLRRLLPPTWRATLLAVDGSVTLDVVRQVGDLPDDASHLVISTGGNDALGHIDILESRPLTAGVQRLASVALTVFNDAIIRRATAARVPLIDLRAACCRPEHYANPIEPSAAGGERIAHAIARVLREHDFGAPGTRIYA